VPMSVGVPPSKFLPLVVMETEFSDGKIILKRILKVRTGFFRSVEFGLRRLGQAMIQTLAAPSPGEFSHGVTLRCNL
jgi:hypothetical protein